ncbi:alpha/beta fold hydrolase [Pseudoalteromonas sp. JBTF-M23]|uniref:Alpha/beta fold hydrolase n=1 Tax=Pseudoalteromonas caenipelagi TaxID=2726988 RepID=A0A849VED3_9GAMM|nr:alpha/beta fold hydrolase [Pseudoalteromonas caenipelagi]NOU50087.1 alpha/beta fold hydrolase [Pseudoalteromonas caenipelagi]
MIEQKSLFISLSDDQKLHLRYIAQPNSEGPAVFFMHGAVENGKIFYTQSNKGLAPFLASQGYRCYVADLRGRGQSLPEISAHSNYGQTEAIMEDIPAMLDYISKHSGGFARFWVAHSWGGVLMNSYFARFPEAIEKVDACAYFGSKRSLHNRHISKYLQANLIWYGLAPLYTKKHGFLPAKSLNWGSDNETKKSHLQGMNWAKRQPWIDSDDDFNYAAALKEMKLPPTLHIAGVKDKALAQPVDIKKFMQESGEGVQELRVYGRKHGHQHNYGHIDMLTHKQAHHDQFKDLLDWFARFDRFAHH